MVYTYVYTHIYVSNDNDNNNNNTSMGGPATCRPAPGRQWSCGTPATRGVDTIINT